MMAQAHSKQDMSLFSKPPKSQYTEALSSQPTSLFVGLTPLSDFSPCSKSSQKSREAKKVLRNLRWSYKGNHAFITLLELLGASFQKDSI